MTTHLLSSLDQIPRLQDTAVTVGSYDGVHRGHTAMIAHLAREAASRGLMATLITFDPHHRIFFGYEREPFLLTDLEEKLVLFARTEVDHVVVLPFVRELAMMSASEFMERILIERLGARLFLIGHDQAIGRDQLRGPVGIAGPAESLGLKTATVEPLAADGETISSTRIRKALRAGDVRQAVRWLGYPYMLTGTVVHGNARGRTLGYPTANLVLAEPFKLVPTPGVYIVRADVPDGVAKGMLYIGRRPTFGDGPQVIELFLIDYLGELYQAKVRVHLLECLREEREFASAEELVAQMRRDEARTRAFFREMNASDTLDRTAPTP